MPKPPQVPQSAGRRTQVLQVLRDANASLSIAEIADRLGIHANTARFHLETLLDNGQVERTRAEPGTPGRPPQLFRVVHGMDPMGPRHYRELAEVLASTLATDRDPSRQAAEAGRHWGHLQASTVTRVAGSHWPVGDTGAGRSVELLMGMLDELGFAPEENIDGARSAIRLRNCPFLELAVNNPEVVCAVHLGLMRGAVASWGSSVTVDRLDTFVQPDLCMVHLGSIGAS